MLTLPDLITLARLALVPLILWLSFSQQTLGLSLAAGLFLVAALTDWLDGFLARRLQTISRFGIIMDPVVDKVLVLGVLFVFSMREIVPPWIFLLLMAREFLITGLRHGISTPERAIGANWMGKTKFFLQMILIGLIYVNAIAEAAGRSFAAGRPLIFWFALIVTILAYLFLIGFVRPHVAGLLARNDPGDGPPD